MERTSAELRKKMTRSQEYNFEHQNVIIIFFLFFFFLFLNSLTFCGQYYKHLKEERYRHDAYS